MIGGRGCALRLIVAASENAGDTEPEETEERAAADTSALRADHAD